MSRRSVRSARTSLRATSGRQSEACPPSELEILERWWARRKARLCPPYETLPINKESTTMASIHKEILIDASPDHVWDALRDFGALHTRLVPGFVTDTKLDGDARIVTFANGTVAREILVDCDDAKRRLVYAIVSESIKQHSASAQVYAESDGRTRFVWIADVLPNEIAPYMDAQMDLGLLAMRKSLGRSDAA